MPAITLTVLSGASISSCFALSPMGRPWELFVPSMSGNTIRCDFTIASGGSAVSFATYYPEPLTDSVVTSSSQRPCFAVIATPPSPWGRLRLQNATSDVASFLLMPVN